MANVSSSNGLEKRPKLRFPGFDEQYKQCRIGDIYAERSQRGASDMELLSVTMNDGVKPRSEIEGKDNSAKTKAIIRSSARVIWFTIPCECGKAQMVFLRATVL